ncbi:MAG TPA: phosphomethylpyrimidine synthase, partial [Chthoniobacterales bacterium]|nr:phosphomethylpyrimidine synthase [Chthoniobacterales bacterium]
MSERNANLPNSKKTFVSGKLHPDIRVPFREITLAPTKSINGEIEINEPVRVYDTSGPWGNPDFHGDVTQGLPPLRAKWIGDRGDVEEVRGRAPSPRDDGYLSEVHRASANGHNRDSGSEIGDSRFVARKPLRARAGAAVTQLAYARRGIVTPEMEFIAIRENLGRSAAENGEPDA